jgi:endonuclease-3
MAENRVSTVVNLLKSQYGSRLLQPDHDPLTELVRTILSQNTSDINSHPAFDALKLAFKNWENVLNADVEEIIPLISVGGLGKIKAQRIKQSLLEIQRRRGKLDLNFLQGMPVAEARDWLKQLPGVGNKTANCVLLFAFGKPALPVDTHIFRVAKRLGLLSEKATLEEAHHILEKIALPEDIYEFHVLVIEHGRRICISRRPRCILCVLGGICPSYEILAVTRWKNKRGQGWKQKSYLQS